MSASATLGSDNITGLILAGGLARRMGGGDKPMRVIGGRTLLDRVIERLAPQCARLVLNANGDPSRFAPTGLQVVPDSLEGHAGPLAGILAGLDYLAAYQPQATLMLSVPGDCPFLPRDLVARLLHLKEAQQADIAVAASGEEIHHTTALWQVSLRDDLRQALTTDHLRAVHRFTARYHVAVVGWPDHPYDPFFNANTEDDLATAEEIAVLADG
jgi:molybdopterin-guanine dinucleotide biosynthesis protein A